MTGDFLPARGYMRVVVLALYIVIGAVLGYIALRWLLAPALPFIAAWAVAAAVQPIADFLSAHTRIPRRVLCIVLACGLFALLGLILTSLCVFLTSELSDLIADLSAEADRILEDIGNLLDSIAERLRIPENIAIGEDYIQELVGGFVRDTLSAVAAQVPSMLGKFIGALPGIVLFAIVTFIASLYLSADYKKIGAAAAGFLPERARGMLGHSMRRLSSALIKYLKAYSLIALITFTELSIGFLVLGIEYALIVAAVIAIADALPVIGAGAALIPWAIVALLRGDYYRGIGLVVIYIVILVVRQFVEPRVLSDVSGLHPLAALAAMYCGLKLFGVAGLFIFPFAAIIAGELFVRQEGDGQKEG